MDLNQITIPSINLHKSVVFYTTLGLQLIVDSIPRYTRFECPTGNSTFSIHRETDLTIGPGITVYFECDTLNEKVKELEAKGIKFETQSTDQTWQWREASKIKSEK